MAKPTAGKGKAAEQQEVQSVEVPEAVQELNEAKNIVAIPGYGMAVAQAQHAPSEVTKVLRGRGKNVRLGIHPVAGRLPGHLN